MRVKTTKSRDGPYDVTNAERDLVRLVYDKEIEIDELGRIWRVGIRYGDKLFSCEPRRAEHKTRDGYLGFRSTKSGRKLYVMAHRLIWQYFHGDIPEGQTINHINGIVNDNRPSNLELANMSEQIKHSFRIGRKSAVGERNPNATLTVDQVERIRILGYSGMKQSEIAKQFGVSKPQISRILSGRAW